MSLHFSANQFEKAYLPQRLGNWEVCKHSKPKRPRPRQGKTVPIVDANGHLLQFSTVDQYSREMRQITSDLGDLDMSFKADNQMRCDKSWIGQSAPQRKTAPLIVTGSALHSTRSLKNRQVKIKASHKEEDSPPTIRVQNFVHDKTATNEETDHDYDEYPGFDEVTVPVAWPKDLPPTPRKAAILHAQRQKNHRPLPDVHEDRTLYSNTNAPMQQPQLIALNSNKAKGPTACTKRRVWKPKAFKPATANSDVVLGSKNYEPGHNMELAIQWEIPLNNETSGTAAKRKQNTQLYQSNIVFSDYGVKTAYKPAIKTHNEKYITNSFLTELTSKETPRLELGTLSKTGTPFNLTRRESTSQRCTTGVPVLLDKHSAAEPPSSPLLLLKSTQRSKNTIKEEQAAFEASQKKGSVAKQPASPGTQHQGNNDSDSESGYQEGSSDEDDIKIKTPRLPHELNLNRHHSHDHFLVTSLPEQPAQKYSYLPEYPPQKRTPTYVPRSTRVAMVDEQQKAIARNLQRTVFEEHPFHENVTSVVERPFGKYADKHAKLDSGQGSQEDLRPTKLGTTVTNEPQRPLRSRPCLACDWTTACTSTTAPNATIPPYHAPLCSSHAGQPFKAGKAQDKPLTDPSLVADRRRKYKIPKMHILNTQARHVKHTLTPPFAVWPGSRGQEFPDIHRLESTYSIAFQPRKNKKSITALLNKKTCKTWK